MLYSGKKAPAALRRFLKPITTEVQIVQNIPLDSVKAEIKGEFDKRLDRIAQAHENEILNLSAQKRISSDLQQETQKYAERVKTEYERVHLAGKTLLEENQRLREQLVREEQERRETERRLDEVNAKIAELSSSKKKSETPSVKPTKTVKTTKPKKTEKTPKPGWR